MLHGQYALLASRRFLPLFVTQFLGAFNDNVFKNAMVILIVYRIALRAGIDGQMIITLAGGLFILPFFLFSATAGQLADKFDKGRLIRIVKFVEILVMGLGAAAFASGSVGFLLAVLFLMGAQSAFFGPLKYGILPDHLAEDELIGGNALIETGTFLAILLGTIVGSLVVLTEGGIALTSVLVVGLAAAGFAAALKVPAAPAADPGLAVSVNFAAATWRILRMVKGERDVFLSILGISWFWLVGATFLVQFPNFAKDDLGADEQVVTLFLTVFSVGIGVGSMLCNRLLKGEVSATWVPLGALGITLFSVDLYLASTAVAPAGELVGAAAFLGEAANWRVVLDLFLVAVCGGIYIVPLYAIMQARTPAVHRARTVAANNVMNALFMVVSALATIAMFAADFSVPGVFLTVALANAGVAVYICRLLPHHLIKSLLRIVFRLLYQVEVRGLEHLEAAGDKAVIVVNHVSFLDGALLAAFLPGRPMFAVNTHVAEAWWARPFLSLVESFPMDPTHPLSTRELIHKVAEGRRCVIFPEGRITVTGSLMKVYDGPGLVADKAGAPLVPARIDGAEFTPFSRLSGKLRLSWFPKITLTLIAPRAFGLPPEVVGRARRQAAGRRLYDVMSEMMFRTAPAPATLFDSVIEAARRYGRNLPIVEDVGRRPLSYGRLIAGALALGRPIAKRTAPGEAVGLMLPNSVGAVVAFLACQARGRVPAMLNFSSGPGAMASCCATAGVRLVLTSRRFVELARLEEAVEALSRRAEVVYLEDMAAAISGFARLAAWLGSWRRRAPATAVAADAPAVILFTSGSEGAPKGVVLSHRNLLANRHQLAARVAFNPSDVVFNALPVFHSFGLTGGMLLPLTSGLRVFMYPSPLHYRIVPELAYDTNATVMFGTDTFLAGYARMANPYDFYSVRLVFAGAEKVKAETRATWMDKFGLRILEGYGATETSPALATNTPMHFKAGSVGRLLPGIEHRLEPVPGVEAGGRLWVRGPNVMVGYLLADQPGEVRPPMDGWYDTGDIVDIDDEGFLTILGRAKRFAKVAGEMVSLGAVERLAEAAWPGHRHAVVALPDPKKGERLVLVSECPKAAREAMLERARIEGVSELAVPRDVVVVGHLPLLGSGKTDYPAVERLVRLG